MKRNKINILLLLVLNHITVYSQEGKIDKSQPAKTIRIFQIGALVQIPPTPEKTYFSFNSYFNIGKQIKKSLLCQTGIEYNRAYAYVDIFYYGVSSGDLNNYFTFDKFSVPIFFNFLSPSGKFLVGGGPRIDLVTFETRRYDYFQTSPISGNFSLEKNQKQVSTIINPTYISFCVKTDYIKKVNKVSLVFGWRFYFPIYAYKESDNFVLWNCHSSLNVGFLF